MDTFARDRLPAPRDWPDLLLLDEPERLNAAVELLAHEGTAIAGGWSYAELRERAEAIAGSLEIEPGTRVLLHSPNTPEAIAAWFGILFAGGIVGRDDAAAARGRDREGGREGAGRRTRSSRAPWPGRSGALDVRVLEELPTTRLVRARRHRRRRRRDHRLHVRHDRRRRRAACTSTATCSRCCDTFARDDPRPAARPTSSAARRRSRSRSGSARSCCSRCASAPRRRRSPSRPDLLDDDPPRRGHDALHRADRLPRAAAREDVPARCTRASRPASRCPPASSDAWYEKTGIRIVDGIGSTEMLHIFIAAPAGGGAGRARADGRCPATRRGSSARTCRRSRRARSAGSRCAARPAAATSTTRARPTTSRRLEPHRRRVLDGRGRLLLVPGAHRRHDHLLGLQHLAASRSRRRCSSTRRSPSARSSPRPTTSAGTSSWPTSSPSATPVDGARAAGPRQGADRAVQVPAPDRVPRRAAADADRQGAAQRAARAGGVRRAAAARAGREPRGYANGIEARAGSCSSAARSAGTRRARSRRRPRRPGAADAAQHRRRAGRGRRRARARRAADLVRHRSRRVPRRA